MGQIPCTLTLRSIFCTKKFSIFGLAEHWKATTQTQADCFRQLDGKLDGLLMAEKWSFMHMRSWQCRQALLCLSAQKVHSGQKCGRMYSTSMYFFWGIVYAIYNASLDGNCENVCHSINFKSILLKLLSSSSFRVIHESSWVQCRVDKSFCNYLEDAFL
jgi:hypothetical protein